MADFVGRPALDDGEDPERERIHARERREGTEEHAQLGLALLDGLHELRSCPRLVEATRVPRADGRGEREGDRARDGRARVPADVEEPVGLRLVDGGNVIFYAYGIRALNDDGWRNDTIIPALGAEVTF